MPEPVKIVVVAETEAAAAKLQDFVQGYGSQLTSKIKETTKAAQELSEGLGSNRMALMELGHVGRSMADGLMAGISPLRMLAMESPRIAQAFSATNISLTAMLPYIGAIAAGAAVLGAEWYAVMGNVEDSTKATEEYLATMDKVPALLEKIHGLQKAGIISPAAAKEFANELANNPKKYRRSDGSITTEQFSEEEIIPDGPAQLNPPDHGWRKRRVENTPMSQADIMAETDKKLPQISKEQAAALTALDELQTKVHENSLFGIEKEKAALEEKNKKLAETIRDTADLARMALTKDGVRAAGVDAKADAMLHEIATSQQRQFDAIDKAAAEKSAREQEAAISKVRIEEKQIVHDRTQALEDELTERQNADGVLRGQFAADEFQQRATLAAIFYHMGFTSEDEYTHAVDQAAKKRVQSEKEYRGELDKIAQLKREIAVGESEAKIRAIQGNPLLTNDQKNAQLLPEYLKLNSGSPGRIADLQAKQSATSDEAAQLEYEKKIKDEMRQQADLQNKIYEIQSSHSFSEQLKQSLVHMSNMQTAAREVGSALERIHDKLQNSLTQGLTGLVMGTKTWQQALSEIYSGVLQQIAQELVQLFVEQVVMKEILNTITGGGSGLIGGIGSLLGFADGGRPPMGQYSLVGERGPELFVPDTAGTILPADQTAALMSGGGGGNTKVQIAVYHDKNEMVHALERSDAHSQHIVNVVTKNVHRFQR